MEDLDHNWWEIQYYPGFQNEDLFDFGDRFSMDDGAEDRDRGLPEALRARRRPAGLEGGARGLPRRGVRRPRLLQGAARRLPRAHREAARGAGALDALQHQRADRVPVEGARLRRDLRARPA